MVGIQGFEVLPCRGSSGFGGPRPKTRQGSRKYVVLSDGSTISWRRGKWRFSSVRWNSAVATSLSRYAITAAHNNGRLQKVQEVFDSFDDFAQRMHKVVGLDNLIDIVKWIQS